MKLSIQLATVVVSFTCFAFATGLSCQVAGRFGCIESCMYQNCGTGYCDESDTCICSRCGTGSNGGGIVRAIINFVVGFIFGRGKRSTEMDETVITEGEGNLEICGTANGTLSNATIIVRLQTQDGTARANSDFNPISASDVMQFTSDDLTQCVTVTINDDSVPEGVETFNIILDTPERESGELGGVTLSTKSIQVMVQDNDNPPPNSSGTSSFFGSLVMLFIALVPYYIM